MTSRVVVVGSANIDYLVPVDAVPLVGQTVLGSGIRTSAGGKGMNQAVASARLGGQVTLIAALGSDASGLALRERLREEQIEPLILDATAGSPTGVALVLVARDGDNAIVAVPGANAELSRAFVTEAIQRVATSSTVVIAQAEIPRDAVLAAAEASKSIGARFVLNLAPVIAIDDAALGVADPLVVNSVEAGDLVGLEVSDRASAFEAAAKLLRISRSVVVTLGDQGACWMTAAEWSYAPSPVPRAVVDTTGAGDCFVGAMATVLAGGGDLDAAVRVGVAAGSFAVESPGAQDSFPRRSDLPCMAG